MTFPVWLQYLLSMSLGFICVEACVNTHSSFWANNTPSCSYCHTLSISRGLTVRWFPCFGNGYESCCYEQSLQVLGGSTFSLLLEQNCCCFTFHQWCYESSGFSTSSPALVFISHFSYSHLVGVKWYLIVALICISLKANNVTHHFMCLSAFCVSLEKCLFTSFASV